MRIQNELNKKGPIDICILGLGMNGHLALIEPAEYLQANIYLATLSAQLQQYQMAVEMLEKPTYGLTPIMADILHSKMILLIINGSHQKEILQKLLSKRNFWLYSGFVSLVASKCNLPHRLLCTW